MENKINGDISGVRKSILEMLELLYTADYGTSDFVPANTAVAMQKATGATGREISVLISRKGVILDVSIGNSSSVSLSKHEIYKKDTKLSGVRCLHTHPGGSVELSSLDTSALIKLKLDSMVAIGVKDDKITGLAACFYENGEVNSYGPFDLDEINKFDFNGKLKEIEKEREENQKSIEEAEKVPKAILVGITSKTADRFADDGGVSLKELEELADTAGISHINSILVSRNRPDSAFFIGSGKVEELSRLRQSLNADMIIFDSELTATQLKNIEDVAGCQIVDRTALILEIFAQRARSREGKVQVELARLRYMLPRLIGQGSSLSRLGGGARGMLHSRGAGETKLDIDRNHIRRRIRFLEEELEEIKKNRSVIKKSRENREFPVIALVGYTNAGKSTLLNKICDADVFAEDKLFATLDPTTRLLVLPDGQKVLVTDTVGFIRRLPHDIVQAFRSTLEEVLEADILVHVVDGQSSDAKGQMLVVNELLTDLGAMDRYIITAINKCDSLSEDSFIIDRDTFSDKKEIYISAITGEGIGQLLERITEILSCKKSALSVLAPWNEGWVEGYIRDNGEILDREYRESGIYIKAMVDNKKISKLLEFVSNE